MAIHAVTAAGTMVVARFLDGRVLRGTTNDFSPMKPQFHLHPNGEDRTVPVSVATADLKALFFVKSFAGDPRRENSNLFREGVTQGRKMRVRFRDGEVIAGYTVGYGGDKAGFFLIPADPDDNNSRIYVVNAAVEEAEWV